MHGAPPSSPPPPGGFNAVFMVGVAGDAYDLDWQAYTHHVDPCDLFNGLENFSPPPFLNVAAADAQIAAAGWMRVSDWNYTDDIWGCVVEPGRQDSERPEGASREESLTMVRAANAAGQLHPPARARAACPTCRRKNVTDVRQVIRLRRPGTFTPGGAHMKFTGQAAWVYRCSACGADGDAQPR